VCDGISVRLCISARAPARPDYRAQGSGLAHTGPVSPKELLHRLVDELPDEQAPRALELLRSIADTGPGQPRRIPSSLGAGDSGRADISARIDEMLADGFGR
jgi:hypothetical protein